jgi:hypothetical protein
MDRLMTVDSKNFGAACRPSAAWVADPSVHFKRRAAGKQAPYSHRFARHNPLRVKRCLPQFRSCASFSVTRPVARTPRHPCLAENRLMQDLRVQIRLAKSDSLPIKFLQPCWNPSIPWKCFPTDPEPVDSACREGRFPFAWPADVYGALPSRFDSKSPDGPWNRTAQHPSRFPSPSIPQQATARVPADPIRAVLPMRSADDRTRAFLRAAPAPAASPVPSIRMSFPGTAKAFRYRQSQQRMLFHLGRALGFDAPRLVSEACFWRRLTVDIAHRAAAPFCYFPQTLGDEPLSTTLPHIVASRFRQFLKNRIDSVRSSARSAYLSPKSG